jgi:hypothetical protein
MEVANTLAYYDAGRILGYEIDSTRPKSTKDKKLQKKMFEYVLLPPPSS